MNQRHLTGVGRWKRLVISRLVGPSLVAGLGMGFSLSVCQGQQTLLETTTPIFVQASKQVSWYVGPQKLSLGDVAVIDLPAGYRLTGKEGAQRILESVNTAVPDDLIGAIITDSGTWMAILEYNAKGYVKDARVAQINTEKVLQQAQAQARASAKEGTPSSISLSWQSLPAYDDSMHSLSWSLKVQDGATTVLNEAVALLGRRGVLQMTAVQPYPAKDTESMQQLAGSIAFKEGEQFADFQDGDPVATAGLSALIVGAKESQTTAFDGATAVVWVYGSLILLLCLPLGFLVLRRKNQRSVVHVPAGSVAHETAANGSAGMLAVTPELALKENGASASLHASVASSVEKRESKHLQRNRRKRMFDYPKFYTDVMQQLSLHAYGTGFSYANGKTNGNGNGHANGNGKLNGHTNGHANGDSNGHQNGHSEVDLNGNGLVNEAVKSHIMELITRQKNLIEEQKCLLEQQTKLIEEKRWLIDEQTAFLRGQAELMEGTRTTH